MEDFIKFKLIEQDKSEKTLNTYRNSLNRFIFYEGDLDVDIITLDHFIDMKYKLKKENFSAYYISNILFACRSFLRYCSERKKMNVLDPKEIKTPFIHDKDIIYYTNDEIKLLMDSIDTDTIYGLRFRALCEVLLGTGVRIDEALHLDRDSIKKEVVDINKNGIVEKKDVFYAYIIGKGKKQRKIFFSDRSLFWLNKYLDCRVDNCPALFVSHHFNIQRISYISCLKSFKNLESISGIDKPVHPHIFRHTFCTNLAKNGAELAHIQKMAGHSNINITIRFYANIDDTDLVYTKIRFLNYG